VARYLGPDMTHSLMPITDVGAEDDVWSGATWIGQIDEINLVGTGRLQLAGGDRFQWARLLVWSGDVPRGFIALRVMDGSVNAADAITETALLPAATAERAELSTPPMTVAVCTRDRPEHLKAALENLAELDYPQFEVLVVDNNPASGLTAPVVEAFLSKADIAVRIVDAPGRGLSIARNVALRNALFDIVAFTDDDVVVNDRWLRNLAYGFGRSERVACVCGMVPSAELLTPAQSYFDRRVGWARRCDAAVYDLSDPPNDDPLFPMRVAQFGTGANFAVQKNVVIEVGGFDEGLGIGSPTGGGEDIDLFVRILLSGYQLVREPSAVVWHKHRRTTAELETQVFNYGLGLGAWIAKLGTNPRTLTMAARRVRPAVKHLRQVTVVEQHSNGPPDPELEALYGRELSGVIRGPVALMTARLAGRKAKPLKEHSSRLLRAFDFRRDRNWGDPEGAIRCGRLALASAAMGLIGLLGAVPALPTVVLAIAVGVFVLAGPGCLALSFYPRVPLSVAIPLIVPLSAAICVVVVSGLLMLGYYDPVVVLLGLTIATSVGGLARCAYLARHESVSPA
jgi:GT2 family glycosyltransferase